MNPDERIFAVLTGDLVGSSQLAAADSRRALDLLRAAAGHFGEACPGSVSTEMDTFRHDSWQWLLESPELALRAAVFLRAWLKMESRPQAPLDTRIAIGLGPVEEIDSQRISNSRGPAFTASGKALDAMTDQRLVLAVPAGSEEEGSVLTALSRASVPLLDGIVSDWTAAESRAVAGALRGWTQEESARQWPADDGDQGISRQAVSKSLRRSHWNRVESVLEWAESAAVSRLWTWPDA